MQGCSRFSVAKIGIPDDRFQYLQCHLFAPVWGCLSPQSTVPLWWHHFGWWLSSVGKISPPHQLPESDQRLDPWSVSVVPHSYGRIYGRQIRMIHFRGAQYQYFVIDSISIILFPFLSIQLSISIILKRGYQYQYLINFSKSSLININFCYQCPPMILLRLPISYQLVIVININIDIN